MVKQNHRFIKRCVKSGLEFGSFKKAKTGVQGGQGDAYDISKVSKVPTEEMSLDRVHFLD